MDIFAYGTLMIPSVMHIVTAGHFRSQKALLRNYARFTVKGQSYPGIIPAADAITHGIVYFDVDEPALRRLDLFEGNLYQRMLLQVETPREKILNAGAYVVKPEYRDYLSSREWDLQEFSQKDLAAFLNTYQGFDEFQH